MMSSIPAFPGAEGYGAYALGGRGGDVYHVTSLGDSGPGTLRYGVDTASGPRTIVFDVSGNIDLESNLVISKPCLTIAGQTAPGLGITVRYHTVVISHTHDVIVRYLRFRHGDVDVSFVPGFEPDSLTLYNVQDVILDHISASWSIDETISVLGTTYAPSDRVTVQWSVIAESLNRTVHPMAPHALGALLTSSDGGYTLHHNLFAHHLRRNPLASGEIGGPGLRLDLVNNVIYNWGDLAVHGNPDGYRVRMNAVGNYAVAGPSTPASRADQFFLGFSYDTRVHQSGNLIDYDRDAVRDGVDLGWKAFEGKFTRQRTRLPSPAVLEDDARTAYQRVLAEAGASKARDAVDTRIIQDVIRGRGGLIDSQDDVGGWPEIPMVVAPPDTDQDGMPDAWELRYGLDPNDPKDRNADPNRDGYTNLEEYLNGTSPVTSLVGHWALDEKSGTAAKDSSTYGTTHTATLSGGAAFVSAGHSGSAVRLDGKNDMVVMPSFSAADLGIHGRRTVSLWFKVDNAASWRKQVIFEEGNDQRGLNIYIYRGQLYVGGWNRPAGESGWSGTFLKTGGIRSGQWHHVALVLDGGPGLASAVLRGYLDGILFGTGQGSQLWPHRDGAGLGIGGVISKTRFHTGVSGPVSYYFFAGMIDDVLLYNSALSASQIAGLVAGTSVVAGASPMPTPLGAAEAAVLSLALWDAPSPAPRMALAGEVLAARILGPVCVADTPKSRPTLPPELSWESLKSAPALGERQ